MIERFCVYCTECESCSYEVQGKSYKCQRFQGNLDFTFRIKIERFFYWLFFYLLFKIRRDSQWNIDLEKEVFKIKKNSERMIIIKNKKTRLIERLFFKFAFLNFINLVLYGYSYCNGFEYSMWFYYYGLITSIIAIILFMLLIRSIIKGKEVKDNVLAKWNNWTNERYCYEVFR